MLRALARIATLALLATSLAHADPAALAKAQALVDAGDFLAAEAAITNGISDSSDEAERAAFEFERIRIQRIRIDFPYDRKSIQEQLARDIPDVTREDMKRWDAQGLFETYRIDGRKRYFVRAASNLYRLSPEALARRKPGSKPLVDGPLESPNPIHAEVIRAGEKSRKAAVAPRRVHVDYSLTVDKDVVPPGKTVRAWLPFPRELEGQQEDVKLVGSEPAKAQVAPASTLQRTAYLEKTAIAGQPTTFSISYELTIFAQRNEIDPKKVTARPRDAKLAEFVREQPPHIVFTPAVREFSQRVVGNETDPYRVALKLFDAVDAFPWAGAREYSTLRNIPDYVLAAGHADCGQQTLLLITLLRLNGIPARWQSGWVYSDGDYDNMHDWGWFYLAPYGWMPMDVTFGKLKSDDPQVARFYFGSLDQYRIAFNDAIGTDFVPRKRFPRSETVDSQRGEVEWDGGNIYFDQWNYEFRWHLLPRRGSARDG